MEDYYKATVLNIKNYLDAKVNACGDNIKMCNDYGCPNSARDWESKKEAYEDIRDKLIFCMFL